MSPVENPDGSPWKVLVADRSEEDARALERAPENYDALYGLGACDAFADEITATLKAHPNVTVEHGEITALPDSGQWIIATGPLTSPALATAIREKTGETSLAFFDAIAPIVEIPAAAADPGDGFGRQT